MTTAERATLQALTAELVMAESHLSACQLKLSGAMNAREESSRKLDQFLSAIPVSDAPVETPARRKYVRKAKELLASAPNAAIEFHSEIGDKHQ